MTAIVFDLDGTLIDSAPDINAIANMVLETEGAAPISLDETRAFIGNGASVFVERMAVARDIAADPARLARMHGQFEALYATACAHSRLYPGVQEMLAALKADGHVLGLCTNKPITPTRFVLDHFAVSDRFDVVLGGDSLPVKKPDPAPLLEVFSRLGAAEEDRLYVGDSEVDAETAGRADIPFALFTGGYRKTPVEELEHEVAFDHFDAIAIFVNNRFA